jgi:hypothetical protein
MACSQGQCINLMTDPQNCGALGTVCPHYANTSGMPLCKGGWCGFSTCSAGYADCNGNPSDGCEVTIINDPKNCGGCARACPSGVSCSQGQCINLMTDPQNCGARGTVCPSGASCSAGSCIIPTYSISGTLKNSSGVAISGAQIKLGGGLSTTTDGLGNYIFKNLPKSSYTITVTIP